KDHASARYIFTELVPIMHTIFHPADDPLLNNLREDNNDIKPYVPIIPLLLLNGKEIIDTGLTTSVPSYNPRKIAVNIRQLMAG
ncbi:DNA topoisomerase, partial [Lactarius indigo]